MQLDDGHYYYYHTLGTILKVLENGTIRARNIAYLNDTDEYWFGLQVLNTQLKSQSSEQDLRLREEIQALTDRCQDKLQKRNMADPLFFPICLTRNIPWEECGLPHWVMYGREAGIAVELDLSNSKQAFWIDTDRPDEKKYLRLPALEDTGADPPRPIEVTYLPQEAVDQNYDGKGGPRPNVTLATRSEDCYALSVKRVAFKQEKEHRLVFEALDDFDDPVAESVKFFEKDGLLSPYLDIYFDNNQTNASPTTGNLSSPGWPIVSVTIGPATNPYYQEREYANLRTILNGPTLKVAALTLEQRDKQVGICLKIWKKRVTRHLTSLGVTSQVSTQISTQFLKAQKDIEFFLNTASNNPTEDLRVMYGNQTRLVLDKLISSLEESSLDWNGYRGDIRRLCVDHCTVLPRHGILLRRTETSFIP